MMDRWTDRLSEYLDGVLAEEERIELEQHLADCLDCRRTLDELRQVVARAQSLMDSTPASDLWAGIAARLESSPQADVGTMQIIELRARRPSRSARHIALTLPQLAAASVALMLVSGTVVWLSLGGMAGGIVQPGAQPAAVRTVSVPASEPADYAAAVQALESVLRENRARLDPVTVAILEENLRAIDSAITEARAALDRDPGNRYLNQHLENTMKKKITLLRRAAGLRGTRT